MDESEPKTDYPDATDPIARETPDTRNATDMLGESYDNLDLLMPGLKERFTALTEAQRDEVIGALQFISTMDDSLPE